MFVCICNGITDSSIRRELEAGARSFADVQERLGVAGQCGSCELHARAIVSEYLAPQPGGFYDATAAGSRPYNANHTDALVAVA